MNDLLKTFKDKLQEVELSLFEALEGDEQTKWIKLNDLKEVMTLARNEFDKLNKELEKHRRDTELLDFLQKLTDKRKYTGRVICRNSTTSRGWRLHETAQEGAVSDVREAIENYQSSQMIFRQMGNKIKELVSMD